MKTKVIKLNPNFPEERLINEDLKDHPQVEAYIIAKAENPKTPVPEYVKQVAQRNVHTTNPDVSQKIVVQAPPQPVATPPPAAAAAAPTTIDWEKRHISAETNHLTQFAVMGEKIDSLAPSTNAIISISVSPSPMTLALY